MHVPLVCTSELPPIIRRFETCDMAHHREVLVLAQPSSCAGGAVNGSLVERQEGTA
jgi:hypothetical protein